MAKPPLRENRLKGSNTFHLSGLILHCSEPCIVVHTLPVRLTYYNGKIHKDINCHMTQGEAEPNRKTLQGWFCDKVVRTRLALNTTSFLNMGKSLRLKS